MKRFLIGLIPVLVLIGCSNSWFSEDSYYWVPPIGTLVDIWDVFDYTDSYIEYVDNGLEFNYLKTPKQIMDDRTGICGEFATEVGYRAYEELGIEDVFIVLLIHPTERSSGVALGHVVVRINGVLYEPQYDGRINREKKEFVDEWLSEWNIHSEYHIKSYLYEISHIHNVFENSVVNNYKLFAYEPAPEPSADF